MRKTTNDELGRLSADEFTPDKKNPFVIVLDNVRSLHNVGSAFRTADAFAADKIYLCGLTGTPPNREINKTALGATETVVWEHAESTLELVNKLKADGYIVVSIEQADESVMLQDFVFDKQTRYAFVFGNEVFGVEEDIVVSSDYCIEIPQFGTKHSLNVSVTIGIVAWDYIGKVRF